MFQQPLKLTHIGKNLTTEARPTDFARRFSTLTAHMNDVVLDGLVTKLPLTLSFIAAGRVRCVQVVARDKQSPQHIYPRLDFAVMEGKRQNATRFQQEIRLPPTFGH